MNGVGRGMRTGLRDHKGQETLKEGQAEEGQRQETKPVRPMELAASKQKKPVAVEAGLLRAEE